MKDYKTSKILKIISYVSVPILVLLIIIHAIPLAFVSTEGEDVSNYKSYTDTRFFSDRYLSDIISVSTISRSYRQNKLNQQKALEKQNVLSQNNRVESAQYDLMIIDSYTQESIENAINYTFLESYYRKTKSIFVNNRRRWNRIYKC